MNHIIISLSDHHYNAISIVRVPSKTKIGKVSWHFKNSLLEKTVSFSLTKKLLSQLKNLKNNHPSKNYMMEYIKSYIKKPCYVLF